MAMKEDMPRDDLSPFEWACAIEDRLFDKARRPLELARKALQRYPNDGPLLELAAFAAVVAKCSRNWPCAT